MSSQEVILREKSGLVGVSVPRLDTGAKVTGRAMYTRDMRLPRMLFASIKRSPFAHARIKAVDTSKAKVLPGVRVITVGKDFPPMTTEDTPALAVDEVLYTNQAVVAVAAETRLAAQRAVEAIEVAYEELPGVFDPGVAMSAETPVVITHPGEKQESPNVGRHVFLRTGDADKGFEKADVVIENTYSTSMESHFQLEPLSFLAQPDPDGGVTIWGTSSGPHKTQAEVSRYLGLSTYQVRVKTPYLGGWFGSKEESHIAAVCAMLALKAKRPVKLELSRAETMTATGVRHPSKIHIKDGLSKDGKVIAREIRAIYNGGAYGSLGNNVMRNSLYGACSVYDIPNLKMDVYRVYTNQTPGTPKRAPIGLQVVWAIESQMEFVASELKLDPIEFRKRNLLVDGGMNGLGEVVEGASFNECLTKVMNSIGWGQRQPQNGPWKTGKGLAIAAKWGPTGPHQAMVRVRENGKVEVWADLVENGGGIYTGVLQIVATEFGIAAEDVMIMPFILGASESATSGLSGGASASRQLVNVGKAAQLACLDVKRKIAEHASSKLNVGASEIDVLGGVVFERKNPKNSVKLSDMFVFSNVLAGKLSVGAYVSGDEFVGYGTVNKASAGIDTATGRSKGGRLSPYYIPVCQAAEVAVNVETGQVKVLRMAAAMDVGKAINPEIVRGQIIGSATMSMSAALGEEMVLSNGRITNANLADYKILNVLDAPAMDPIILETEYHNGPFGAKGAGEPSSLPTAACIGNALHDAIGVWFTALPITPERVLEALSGPG